MRAGPLSSPKIINLLNTHFVNVWVLLRELPELQTGAKGAAAGVLATKLRQHYSDSVDILTLTPELEVIEHLPSKSLLHKVKKIYDTYKDQGFDIIGVSLDTDETKLRNYLQENDIPWRQIYSGLERQSPLAQQYDVRSIPARWLVDRAGQLIAHEARHKLISRKGREADLEQLVASAVENG